MEALTAATLVCRLLQKKGHQAVFAGGCVRDKLLGIEPHDFDIATSATPDEVQSVFPGGKAVGKAFGVVLVKFSRHEFEVATFRTDGEYSDGRRPDSVTFASMEEDALRRDFTINAIFFDPISNEFHDFVGGRDDIGNKILKFVGDPFERIEEDKLRMLRFCRFAGKFKFNLDSHSFDAVRAMSPQLHFVAPERIREEFMKMLALGTPRGVMEILFKTHLIHRIIPEVADLEGCNQDPVHHPEGDVLTHTLMVMDSVKDEDPILQLAALLHDIGKPATTQVIDGKISHKGHEKVGASMTEAIMHRLKFSNDEIEHVVALVEDHMKVHVVKDMKKSTIKKLLSTSHADDLIKLGKADVFGRNDDGGWSLLEEHRDSWEPEIVKPEPIITGRHLIEMGFEPGPIFKEILSAVQDEQLEDNIVSEEQAIKFVQERWHA